MGDAPFRYWLVAITAVGAVPRVVLSVAASPRYDEAYTHLEYVVRSWGTVLSDYVLANNHIFHTALARAVHLITGGGIVSTRIPALVAGIAVIPLTILLTHRLTSSRSSALIAGALVAFWPQLIRYSADARGYTLVATAALVLAHLAWNLALRPRPDHGTWAVAAGVAALGLWTIPTFLYPVIGLTAWAAFLRHREHGLDRPWITHALVWSAVSGGLTVILWLPVVVRHGVESITAHRFIVVLPPGEWVRTVPTYAGDVVGWATEAVPTLVLVVVLGAAVIGAGSAAMRGRASFRAFGPAVAVLGASGVVMAAQRVQPFTRIWVPVLPLVAVAMGAVVWPITSTRDAGRGWDRLLGALGAAALAITTLVSVAQAVDVTSELRADEPAPDAPTVVHLAAQRFPEGVGLVVRPDDDLPFMLAARAYENVRVPPDAENLPVLYVVNHRHGETAADVAARAGLNHQRLQPIFRTPGMTVLIEAGARAD